MYTHFTNVINELKSLEKSYNVDLVNKILSSLSKEPKVTAIQKAKNEPLTQLLGSLSTQ